MKCNRRVAEMVRELAAVARWVFCECVMIGIAIWTVVWFADIWRGPR